MGIEVIDRISARVAKELRLVKSLKKARIRLEDYQESSKPRASIDFYSCSLETWWNHQ